MNLLKYIYFFINLIITVFEWLNLSHLWSGSYLYECKLNLFCLMKIEFWNLEICFHKHQVSFLVVKTVKCKRDIKFCTTKKLFKELFLQSWSDGEPFATLCKIWPSWNPIREAQALYVRPSRCVTSIICLNLALVIVLKKHVNSADKSLGAHASISRAYGWKLPVSFRSFIVSSSN